MPGWRSRPHATESPSGTGDAAGSLDALEWSDFHGYLARNLPDAYRLAVMTLDDPIEAGTAVHDTMMGVWLAAGAAPVGELDAAFKARLEAEIEKVLRGPRASEEDVPVEPLGAAVGTLDPRLQVELAREFGLRASLDSTPVGETAGGAESASGGALRGSEARLDADDAADAGPRLGAESRRSGLQARLRALYEARDPGETAPLHMRLRLAQDYREAETARGEVTRRRRDTGWGFVFNAFLALVVLTLVVALASTVDLRASSVASGDPVGDPASPLAISDVTLVQGGIDGEAVHVGATQRTLIAAFAASPLWHASSKDCLADIVGVIDWQGEATWVGARAGHADAIVGDPSSTSAFVTGPGSYCELGRFISADGGSTWSAGSLPGNADASPTWLAFDPTQAHMLLAYYPGRLYVSPDAGLTWTSRKSVVTPLAFDSAGRLVGWAPGKLFESLDEGASWQQTGPGPLDAPTAAGATSNGALVGAKGGLWWYPLTAAPSLVRSGSVFSIATLGDGAVVLGADSTGRPWLGTVNDSEPGISLAALPPDVTSLKVTGGGVAANDSGAVVAFSGSSSLIALVGFVR